MLVLSVKPKAASIKSSRPCFILCSSNQLYYSVSIDKKKWCHYLYKYTLQLCIFLSCMVSLWDTFLNDCMLAVGLYLSTLWIMEVRMRVNTLLLHREAIQRVESNAICSQSGFKHPNYIQCIMEQITCVMCFYRKIINRSQKFRLVWFIMPYASVLFLSYDS